MDSFWCYTCMNRKAHRMITISAITFIAATTASMASEAFEKTPSGEIEIKELPAGRLLESQSERDYFDESNGLFRPLFSYIQKNDISMTTPVEAQIAPGKMYFWVAEDQKEKARIGNANVSIIDVQVRKVAAVGARGSYSRSNYEEAKAKLLKWIESNDAIQPISEPYAVYWNGPFTPWFVKTFEVHVQIEND